MKNKKYLAAGLSFLLVAAIASFARATEEPTKIHACVLYTSSPENAYFSCVGVGNGCATMADCGFPNM